MLEEWAKQASLETDLDLPVSVIASADQALQAKGQIGFIDLFTQPLFEAVSDVLPELQKYADSCAENRGIWSQRSEVFQSLERTALVQPVIESASADDRFKTLFPLSLPVSLVEPNAGGSQLSPDPAWQGVPSLSNTPSTGNFSGRSTYGNGPGPGSGPGPNGESASSYYTLQTPKSSDIYSFQAASLHPESESGSHPSSASGQSTAVKAVRAVYRANILNERRRLVSGLKAPRVSAALMPGVNSGLGQGKGGREVYDLYERRASTPDGLTVRVHEHGMFQRRFLV